MDRRFEGRFRECPGPCSAGEDPPKGQLRFQRNPRPAPRAPAMRSGDVSGFEPCWLRGRAWGGPSLVVVSDCEIRECGECGPKGGCRC